MHKNIKIVFLVLVGVVLVIGTPPVQGPSNLSAEAIPDKDGNPGGALKLTWEEPDFSPGSGGGCWGSSEEEADEWRYNVYLDGVFVAEEIEDTEYDLYVQGGVIEMTAVWGDVESDDVRLDIRPTTVVTLEVYELNGEGASGIGFSVFGEWISTYMMSDSTNRNDIDCYFTNWSPGYQGTYSLAGADQVTSDPGGESFAATGWHATLISGPLDVSDIKDVEIVPVQGYASVADSVVPGNTYAVLTQDGYYGLIQVMTIDTTNGEIEIKTTFQPIKGLRWM